MYNKSNCYKSGGESMKNVIKTTIKILILFSVFILLFYTFNTSFTYAAKSDAKEFDPYAYKPKQSAGDDKLLDIGNKIIGPIQMIGSIVSVIALIVIGIKYMMGSVEEKAQYKETMKPYIIGAVLVFGITNILTIVYDIATQIFN